MNDDVDPDGDEQDVDGDVLLLAKRRAREVEVALRKQQVVEDVEAAAEDGDPALRDDRVRAWGWNRSASAGTGTGTTAGRPGEGRDVGPLHCRNQNRILTDRKKSSVTLGRVDRGFDSTPRRAPPRRARRRDATHPGTARAR